MKWPKFEPLDVFLIKIWGSVLLILIISSGFWFFWFSWRF